MSLFDFLLQNKNFLFLLITSCIFGIASEFNHVSISVLTDNNVIYYMINYIIWCIFPLFTSIITGSMIDIYDKKKLIVILIIINSFVIYGFSLSYYLSNIYVLFICSGIFYSIDSTITNSIFSYTPEIVDKNDLYTANSIESISLKIMPLFGMSCGGIILYYTNIYTNIFITCGLFLFSLNFVYSIVITEKKEKKENSHQIEIPDTQIVVIEIENNTNKNTNINYYLMFKESCIYLYENEEILYLIMYKSFINILLGSFVIINYNNSYNVFTNNKKDGIKLFVLSNSIEVFFSVFAQYIFHKYTSFEITNMKHILKYTIIPVVLSIGMYIFSNNIYCWLIGNIVFGCCDIIIFTIISTILQTEVKKEIQGRIFTLGYNIRVFLCAIGSIIISLVIYYNNSYLQYTMMIYFVIYFLFGIKILA